MHLNGPEIYIKTHYIFIAHLSVDKLSVSWILIEGTLWGIFSSKWGFSHNLFKDFHRICLVWVWEQNKRLEYLIVYNKFETCSSVLQIIVSLSECFNLSPVALFMLYFLISSIFYLFIRCLSGGGEPESIQCHLCCEYI